MCAWCMTSPKSVNGYFMPTRQGGFLSVTTDSWPDVQLAKLLPLFKDEFCNTGNKISSWDFHVGDSKRGQTSLPCSLFHYQKYPHYLVSSTELLFITVSMGGIVFRKPLDKIQLDLEATNCLETRNRVWKDYRIVLLWAANTVYGAQKS